jgi:biotin transport system substrate-specific component
MIFRIIFVVVGSLFLAALAQISFYLPFDRHVPVTLQTLGVLLIGTLYGWILGVSTIILYLLEGLVGLPFFAEQSGGYKVLEGATAGYLFGFILSAFITVLLDFIDHNNNIVSRLGMACRKRV